MGEAVKKVEGLEKTVGFKDLLRCKNYCIMVLATAISRFGDSVDAIAYAWMVYQLTGSKLLMGTLFALNFIPNIVFSIFSGVFADYFPKKRTIILCDFGRGSVVALTAFLFLTGHLQPWYLFVFTIMNSTLETFSSPARGAFIPLLIDKELYLTATSYASSIYSFSELIGAGMAGFLIATLSISGAIFVDAATFYISFLLISTLRVKNDKKSEEILTTKLYLNNLKGGFKFIIEKKLLIVVVLLGAIANFSLSPINVLMPVYVSQILKSGPEGLSILGFSISLGMIVGGIFIGQIGQKFKKSKLIVTGFLFVGINYALLSLPGFIHIDFIKPIFIGAICFFLMGVSILAMMIPTQTYVMENTPRDMMGRVGSFMGMAMMCATPLGAFLTGIVSEFISLPILFMVMAFFMIAVIIITGITAMHDIE